MASDRRSEVRRRSFLGGKLRFHGRGSVADCVLTNFSVHGAKLTLASAAAVPAEFELHIPAQARTYRAQAKWRDSNAIGVALEVSDQQRSGSTPLEQDLLMRSLRRANAALRRRLRSHEEGF